MRTLTHLLATAALVVSASGAARAQVPVSRPTGTVAGIAPAPQSRDHERRADRDGDRDRDEHGHRDRRGDDGIRVGHVFFGPNVPVLVASDGRVYANFGGGFVPVVQNCDVPTSSLLSAAPMAMNGPVQPQVSQPVVTQPGAVQPGPVAAAPLQLGEAPNTVCWVRDERGAFRVARR